MQKCHSSQCQANLKAYCLQLQLMQETVKKVKDERSSGDIAMMKNEIHKMEMRLSHLRRVQEKLIHDMEFCVTRREMIVDRVTSKLKRDPKCQHNQKVIFCKRLADQRLKIRQIIKVIAMNCLIGEEKSFFLLNQIFRN